jgi:hypothetical protein
VADIRSSQSPAAQATPLFRAPNHIEPYNLWFFRTEIGSSDRRQYFETYGSQIGVQPRAGREGPEGEKRYRSTLSLTSALDWGGWLRLRPGHLTPRMTRYPMYGWWVGLRVGLDGCGKISPPLRIRSPDRPPLSESLYRLSYSDPTLSEDMCSNVLFIRIRSRIFPNPQYKDAALHRFTVNDHEIELWRSHHYLCTYCKKSVLILLCENERWRRLVLKESSNTPGTYIRVVAL